MMETFMAAMTSIRKYFEKKDVDGQALIEYALILVLVAIAVIVILRESEEVSTIPSRR